MDILVLWQEILAFKIICVEMEYRIQDKVVMIIIIEMVMVAVVFVNYSNVAMG